MTTNNRHPIVKSIRCTVHEIYVPHTDRQKLVSRCRILCIFLVLIYSRIKSVFLINVFVSGHWNQGNLLTRSVGTQMAIRVCRCLSASRDRLSNLLHFLLPLFPFLPSPHPTYSPNPKSNTKHSNTSVSPPCVWCCWGYPLRSLGDGDREGGMKEVKERIGRGVPGWLCCVHQPTPDVTSFRFTSAAKLE